MAPEPSAAATTHTPPADGRAETPAAHQTVRAPDVAPHAAATPGAGPGPAPETGGHLRRVAARRAAGCITASPAAADGADGVVTDAVAVDAGHRRDRYPTVGQRHPRVASRPRGRRRRDPLAVDRRPSRDRESRYADTSPWSSWPRPPAGRVGTDRLGSAPPSARGPNMTVPPVAARIPPMRPAVSVLQLGDPDRLECRLQALSDGSGAGSAVAVAVTDGHRSGRWWVDRPTPAAASRRRPAAGSRGGRDA